MRMIIIATTLTLLLLVIPFESKVFTYSEGVINANLIGEELEQIFMTKANIWNKFVLGGYETIRSLELDLREISVDPLLSSDLKIFNELKNNPTSYELIESVTIQNFELIDINKYYAIGNVQINWVMQDGQQTYMEEIDYTVYLLRVHEKWMLSDYVIE